MTDVYKLPWRVLSDGQTVGWRALCDKCPEWQGATRETWEQARDDCHDHAVDHDYVGVMRP